MANYAIASLSYLAANYETESFKANAETIAKARALSKPLVGKLMSQMSTAGLVEGVRGPGGGFTLARHPKDITLIEIVRLFEKVEEGLTCPFGPGWCGNGDPCPLHYELAEKNEEMIKWLGSATLDLFTKWPVKPDRSQGTV